MFDTFEDIPEIDYAAQAQEDEEFIAAYVKAEGGYAA